MTWDVTSSHGKDVTWDVTSSHGKDVTWGVTWDVTWGAQVIVKASKPVAGRPSSAGPLFASHPPPSAAPGPMPRAASRRDSAV